jgi:hypothetical protein
MSDAVRTSARSTAKWWTPADQAELELLLHELVKTYFEEHRNRCAYCRGEESCPRLRRAIEAVLDWREARELRSRAAWLRAERDRLEASA